MSIFVQIIQLNIENVAVTWTIDLTRALTAPTLNFITVELNWLLTSKYFLNSFG